MLVCGGGKELLLRVRTDAEVDRDRSEIPKANPETREGVITHPINPGLKS